MNEKQKRCITVDIMESYRRSDTKPDGWSEEQALIALGRYEKFFMLAAKYPGHPLAPTKDIDVMWHLHMLSPQAYFNDCMLAMGAILDHNGGYGKGEGELPRLQATFAHTERLWMAEYGEPYFTPNELDKDGLIKCWHDCQSRCWHACSNSLVVEAA